MKIQTKWFLTFLLLLPLMLFASEPVIDVPDVGNDDVSGPSIERTISLWQFLIPIVVPMIIAGLKAALPKLPTRLIPILAPIIGALIDVLLNYMGAGGGIGIIGAAFGSAGVGVREIMDQNMKPKETK